MIAEVHNHPRGVHDDSVRIARRAAESAEGRRHAETLAGGNRDCAGKAEATIAPTAADRLRQDAVRAVCMGEDVIETRHADRASLVARAAKTANAQRHRRLRVRCRGKTAGEAAITAAAAD